VIGSSIILDACRSSCDSEAGPQPLALPSSTDAGMQAPDQDCAGSVSWFYKEMGWSAAILRSCDCGWADIRVKIAEFNTSIDEHVRCMQSSWVGAGNTRDRESGSRLRPFRFACMELAHWCFVAQSHVGLQPIDESQPLRIVDSTESDSIIDCFLTATLRAVRASDMVRAKGFLWLPVFMGADLLAELVNRNNSLTERVRRTPNFAFACLQEWITALTCKLEEATRAPDPTPAQFFGVVCACVTSFMDRWSKVFTNSHSPITMMFRPPQQVWRHILAPLPPGETSMTAGAVRSMCAGLNDPLSIVLSDGSTCVPFVQEVQTTDVVPAQAPATGAVALVHGSPVARLRSLRMIVGIDPLKPMEYGDVSEQHAYFGSMAACVRSIIRRRFHESKSSTVVSSTEHCQISCHATHLYC